MAASNDNIWTFGLLDNIWTFPDIQHIGSGIVVTLQNAILLESGGFDYMLLESGDALLLEG